MTSNDSNHLDMIALACYFEVEKKEVAAQAAEAAEPWWPPQWVAFKGPAKRPLAKSPSKDGSDSSDLAPEPWESAPEVPGA